MPQDRDDALHEGKAKHTLNDPDHRGQEKEAVIIFCAGPVIIYILTAFAAQVSFPSLNVCHNLNR